MSNTKNYGWAYVHPTASQAQARGVDKSIQFLTGAVDSNGIGLGSGSAKLTFDYAPATPVLRLSGNMTASGHVSASAFFGDGAGLEGVSSFPYNGHAVINGNLNVTGSITASNYIIQNTLELNNAGSSQFGNTAGDTHVFSGSVSVHSGTFTILSGNVPSVRYNNLTEQLKIVSLRVAYKPVAATTYTASVSDYIIGVQNTNAVTIRLPNAATAGSGSILVIKDEVGSPRANPNEITVSASAGQTVDGAAHNTLGAGTLVSAKLFSNGNAKWFII